jgi:hypothetical protein
MLKGQENFTHIDLQLGVTEHQMYYSVLIKSKSQTELDRLHQLHILDMTEDDKDRSW